VPAAFICPDCKITADSKLPVCLGCGSHAGYWPVMHRALDGVVADTKVITSKQLWAKRGRFLDLPAEWQKVVGALPSGSASWLMQVHGPPGSGKTTFALRLLGALSDLGLVSLADLFETGFGVQSSGILQRLELRSERVLICCVGSYAGLVEIVREHEPDVLLLDSVSDMTLHAQDVARLQRELDVSVVYICHATKGGSYKGDSSWLHLADVAVELLPDRRYRRVKSRFASTMPEARVLPWEESPL
jgi:predicted ATP-dependent serine protease